MDTLKSLQNIWKQSLSAKYGYSDEKSRESVDDSIKVLSNIFLKFNNSPYADKKFSRQIINGTDKQYEQALSEMLFFDILERNNFKLLPTADEGPDFHVQKENYNIMCEVIAPKPDNEGITEWHNNDLNTRLGAGARRTRDQDLEIFLKITSALKTKQEKFKTDKEKGLIPPNAACVVVINDALFLPEDIPMFGVSHSANWGEAPYIARATLSGTFTLLTKKLKPIHINGFLNTSLDHISAVIQVTLRDDYGHRICLVDKLNEQFCRLAGFTNDYDIVLNNQAKTKLPNNIFKMDHWHLNRQGELLCDHVPKRPSLHDVARHHNLQRKSFGLPEIDEENLIFKLSSGQPLW